LFGILALDELIKAALLTAGSFVLHQQRKIVLVKLFKPFVPADLFERLLAAESGKVKANHSDVVIVSGPANGSRRGAARLYPAADFIVIGEVSGG
jgi:hypothetical protein